MTKHISFEQKRQIAQYYQSKPMTIEDCANNFQISNPTTIKILDTFKVKRWRRAILYSPDLNEHYFDEIDSPTKAYWLGLLMTDGCVFDNKHGDKKLCLTLKTQDEYLIKEFLQALNCNKKIVHANGRTESSVQIASDILCDSLAKYGVIPQKTGKQHFICPAYQEAYLHGLIDGDGSISFYARPNRKCHFKSIRLCGANREFLEETIRFTKCGRIELSREGLETIIWKRNDDMMRIIEAVKLYSTPCLKRKMILMNKVESEIREYRDNRVKTAS